MNEQDQKRIEQLLKNSLTGIGDQDAQLRRDLWPGMLKRMDDEALHEGVPWFDWVLLAAVAVLLAFFPSAIPVLFYHL